MAKGKYQQWLEPDGLTLLKGWARKGLTDEQIAHNCGISTKTLYEWKGKYGEISGALKEGKEVVDLLVENALLKRALGYTYEEKTYERKPVNEEGDMEMVLTKTVVKEVVADTTAQIYWMNNRDPAHWRGNKDAQERNRIELERLKMEQAAAEAEEKNAAAGCHVTFSVTHGDEPAVDEVMG